MAILKHGPGRGNRALLAAKFEETALPTPGSQAPTWELPRYPWARAQGADWPLLARCTEASATSQYCVLSPVLSLVIMGKGTSGSAPQIICLSRERTGDAQNSPVLRGADYCPSQSSALYCGRTACNSCYCVTTIRRTSLFPLLSGDVPTPLVMERMSESLVKKEEAISSMGKFCKRMARAQLSRPAVTCSTRQRTQNTP